MLLFLGAVAIFLAIIFLGFFIFTLFNGCIYGLKEFIVFVAIAALCIGTVFYVNSLLYEEVTVNEYEVVNVTEDTFSYKTEDGGIAEKYKRNAECISQMMIELML